MGPKVQKNKSLRQLKLLKYGYTNMIKMNLEAGKRFAHTASHGYQLRMATLQIEDRRLPNCACNVINQERNKSENLDRVIIIVEHDLKEHILCILDAKKTYQCKLNLYIEPGEQVAFRTIGKIPVQLTGVSFEAE